MIRRNLLELGGFALLVPAVVAYAGTGERFSTHLAPLPRGYVVRIAPTATLGGGVEQSMSLTPESGWVTAHRQGDVLKISGSFANLRSPATSASIKMGAVTGVGGEKILPLEVAHARDGKIDAAVRLNGQQMAWLYQGRLYVEIASEGFPQGDIRGWLLGEDWRK